MWSDNLSVNAYQFTWQGYTLTDVLCPCKDCTEKTLACDHTHVLLEKSWERIVAPCDCAFLESPVSPQRELFYDDDGIHKWTMACPLGGLCSLRIFYINQASGERTIQCPCTACRSEVGISPCLTLEGLFGDEKQSGLELEELENDSVIPKQDFDVPPGYFHDLPGFELVETHLASESDDKEMWPDFDDEGTSSEKAASISYKTESRAVEPPALRDLVRLGYSFLKTTYSTILAALVSRTAISLGNSPVPSRISFSELLEVLAALTLSLFLVIVYECFGIYLYVKELPKPPAFLWKSMAAVLLVLGLRYLRYGII